MNFLTFSFLVAICIAAINVASTKQAVHTACGGTVEISTTEDNIISYKEDEVYGYEERCIWSLLPEDPTVVFSNIELTFENVSDSYSDGFHFFSWSDNGALDGEKLYLSVNKAVNFKTTQGFLYFSTDYGNTEEYKGFRIRIRGDVSEASSKVDQRVIINSVDLQPAQSANCETVTVQAPLTISYPNFPAVSYKDNTKLAIILQRNRTLHGGDMKSVTLDFLESEEGIDTLEVYYLRPYGYHDYTHTKSGSYSGQHLNVHVSEHYESTLILFRSDHQDTGRGFQVTWT